MNAFTAWIKGEDLKSRYRLNKISLLDAERTILIRQTGVIAAIALIVITINTTGN